MLQRLFTLKELSDSLRVSISTLRRAVKSGELKCVRADKRGQIRVSEADYQAYVAACSAAEASVPADTHPSRQIAEPAVTSGPSIRKGNVGKNLSYTVMTADVVAGLRTMQAESVACMVTSPPYFWQREYGVDGQIGHEDSIAGYVSALVEAFTEAKRVLAPDGLLFLNLGDAYYNAKGKPTGRDPKHSARQLARVKLRAVDGPGLGLPRKSLIGLPWRVALAMQATGWTLRSSIIWQRPNSLGEPTSKDRPWRTHENVFMFSKQVKYFFDRTAVGADEDVWSFKAKPENPYAHCAPFPIELVDRCLKCGCAPGGTVLDPFLGSGTTMVSALRLGHPAVGIELNDEYAGLAERRILDDWKIKTLVKKAERPAPKATAKAPAKQRTEILEAVL